MHHEVVEERLEGYGQVQVPQTRAGRHCSQLICVIASYQAKHQ